MVIYRVRIMEYKWSGYILWWGILGGVFRECGIRGYKNGLGMEWLCIVVRDIEE